VGEFVSQHDIPNAELVAAGIGGTVERTIRIPPAAGRWTLQIVPVDGGAAADPTFVLEYDVGGNVFVPINPAAAGTALRDKTNVITREDVVTRVKAKVTNGASVIAGDVLIRLYESRE